MNCYRHQEEYLMKKTLLKTTMIAAIATLGLNGQAWAHHPSEDTNPNFDTVDDLVSDMHNEVIDPMLEDGDLMSSTARGMDATSSPSMASGDGAIASQASTQAATQMTSAPGRGDTSAARSSGRR
jgi:hypothetical protein